MSKLYYTDPLKAAWMSREFGVELGEYDPDGLFLEICWPDALEFCMDENPYKAYDRYYIPPDRDWET